MKEKLLILSIWAALAFCAFKVELALADTLSPEMP